MRSHRRHIRSRPSSLGRWASGAAGAIGRRRSPGACRSIRCISGRTRCSSTSTTGTTPRSWGSRRRARRGRATSRCTARRIEGCPASPSRCTRLSPATRCGSGRPRRTTKRWPATGSAPTGAWRLSIPALAQPEVMGW